MPERAICALACAQLHQSFFNMMEKECRATLELIRQQHQEMSQEIVHGTFRNRASREKSHVDQIALDTLTEDFEKQARDF